MTVTSAGIYDAEDKLVRTLWSAEANHPSVGNPGAFWDGRRDDLTVAAAGTYTAKVLSSDCTYTWEGVLGNTSVDHIDNMDYHNHACPISAMEITAAGEMYFSTGYSERWPTLAVTTTADPQVAEYLIRPLSFRESHSSTGPVATDGVNAYFFMIVSSDPTVSFVHAVNCTTKEKVVFSSGEFTYDLYSAIAKRVGTVAFDGISNGMAVQKGAGTFLFLGRQVLGQVLTLNKTTGALLQTNTTWVKPGAMQVSPTTGELWLAHCTSGTTPNVVSKLAVSGAGVLSATAVSITGFGDVAAVAVSPDGATILVADATTHQVRAYNTSDGSAQTAWATSGALGVAGGYASSPTVTDTKFMFKLVMGFGGGPCYLAYQADGSFWLGDSGNNRSLRFSAGNSPAVVNRISFIPSFYACKEHRGDPTRIYASYLEYSVNYALPLASSWTLVRNWAAGLPVLPARPLDQYNALKWAGTYSNGRDYGFIYDNTIGWVVHEMTSTGLRDTGVRVSAQNNCYPDRDFDFWFVEPNAGGDTVGTIMVRKNAFTGFDASHNPTWAADPEYPPGWMADLVIPQLPARFPRIDLILTHHGRFLEPLSNGVIPVYDTHSVDSGPTKHHFGGLRAADGVAMFSAHPPTPLNYGNPNWFLVYPESPYFPNAHATAVGGQSLNDFGGGSAFWEPGHAHVFTSYSGELWGNNQTNMWYHWHETGLLAGRFGVAAPYFGASYMRMPNSFEDGETATNLAEENFPNYYLSFKGLAQMAGNAFNGGLTFVNDKYYCYCNDEWYHGGVHRFVVDGLDSVTVTEFEVEWSGVYSPTTDPTDLLDGLPYDQLDLPEGTAGWHRSPTTDISTGGSSHVAPWYKVYTNAINCSPFGSPDLTVITNTPGVPITLYKDLSELVSDEDWIISSEVIWHSTTPQSFLKILDSTGKVIVRLANGYNPVSGPYCIYVNNFASGDQIANPEDAAAWINYCFNQRVLTIQGHAASGTLTITYGQYSKTGVGVYEVGADPMDPARIQFEAPAAEQTALSFIELGFQEIGVQIVTTTYTGSSSFTAAPTIRRLPLTRQIEMITHAFDPVSNLATWEERVALYYEETGELVDLAETVDNIVVTLRDPYTATNVLTGDLEDETVFLLTGNETFGWMFTPEQMAGLDPKTYEVGVHIEVEGEIAQAILARISVVRGL